MKVSKVFFVLTLIILTLPVSTSAAKQDQRPYREENVTFHVGDITLAGTLTIPNETGRHSVVILISGGNADNRDAQVGEFRPFHIIADHLSRKGVVVLRYDDRGMGESTGKHTWQ